MATKTPSIDDSRSAALIEFKAAYLHERATRDSTDDTERKQAIKDLRLAREKVVQFLGFFQRIKAIGCVFHRHDNGGISIHRKLRNRFGAGCPALARA